METSFPDGIFQQDGFFSIKWLEAYGNFKVLTCPPGSLHLYRESEIGNLTCSPHLQLTSTCQISQHATRNVSRSTGQAYLDSKIRLIFLAKVFNIHANRLWDTQSFKWTLPAANFLCGRPGPVLGQHSRCWCPYRWLNGSPKSISISFPTNKIGLKVVHEEWGLSSAQSRSSPSLFSASRRSSSFPERGQMSTLIPWDRGSFWESPEAGGGRLGSVSLLEALSPSVDAEDAAAGASPPSSPGPWPGPEGEPSSSGPSGSLKAAGAGTICRLLTAGGFERTSGDTGPGDWRPAWDGEWEWDGVVGGVRDAGLTGEEGAAQDLLFCGECLGLRMGPASTSSPLSRPSFLRASIRIFWGSIMLAGVECPAMLSGTGAALCDFRIMLAGSFLGFGATAGGVLGSRAGLEGGLGLLDNELCSGACLWDSGVTFIDALWRSSSRSTGLLLDFSIDGGGSLALPGPEWGPGSSMKSDGGGIRLRSISELCLCCSLAETIFSWPSLSLVKHNILLWGEGPTSQAAEAPTAASVWGLWLGVVLSSLTSAADTRAGLEASSSVCRCLGPALTSPETPKRDRYTKKQSQPSVQGLFKGLHTCHTIHPIFISLSRLGQGFRFIVGQSTVLLHLQRFYGFLQIHETRPLLSREVLRAVFTLHAKTNKQGTMTKMFVSPLPSGHVQKAKVFVFKERSE